MEIARFQASAAV